MTAAGSGTVAAITRDVDNVPIIVVRHDGNLMTVYAGLDNVAVNKGDKVSTGTTLGRARNQGIVHFEVRDGFESVDPEKYLN
ncbi:M23 family metallopeptidase [Paracoccus cavernae]|uniref:M23 family metallopeptidase n=1 Tax=Paracoccus cavernae TaxID=1571207 RepID=A0ABT8D8H1_9RHOB|nr:M23 family metallopeptidase [Paracoccus cavernae]